VPLQKRFLAEVYQQATEVFNRIFAIAYHYKHKHMRITSHQDADNADHFIQTIIREP
jgi:hypothetical protein